MGAVREKVSKEMSSGPQVNKNTNRGRCNECCKGWRTCPADGLCALERRTEPASARVMRAAAAGPDTEKVSCCKWECLILMPEGSGVSRQHSR